MSFLLDVFEKCTEDSSRQRAHGARIPKNILVRFWVKLVGIWSDIGQMFGEIGQIVGQILENFSQILTISTLDLDTTMLKHQTWFLVCNNSSFFLCNNRTAFMVAI